MSLGSRVKETPFTVFGQSADGKHALKKSGRENNSLKKQIPNFKATLVATATAIVTGRKWRGERRGMDE